MINEALCLTAAPPEQPSFCLGHKQRTWPLSYVLAKVREQRRTKAKLVTLLKPNGMGLFRC